MGNLNRRDFLKALGLATGTSALSACQIDSNRYYTPVENVLPYVVRPDQVNPGNPTFFATTVLSGPRAYPQALRHREGRVINVGANLTAPFAKAVAPAALFELLRTYDPDRIRSPKDGGPAGADLAWDAALAKLADAVKAAKASGKKVAFIGSYRSGSIAKLLADFTGGNAVFWEVSGYEAEAVAAEQVFGKRFIPQYKLDTAQYVLSFGAEFLGTWGGSWLEAAYSTARNPNAATDDGEFKGKGYVARFAAISSHRGQTAANADDFLACTPGSEVTVALAIAKALADLKGYTGPAKDAVGNIDLDKAAAASGIDKARLEAVVQQLNAAGRSAILPGGLAGASATSVELAAATYLLNIIAGNLGTTFDLSGYTGPIHTTAALKALLDEAKAGQVGVLLLDDANFVHQLPAELGAAEAIAKVDLAVAVTSHGNETIAGTKLVLPTNGPLEDWGDEEPIAGLHLVRQPGMTALHDTRSLGDILLAVWRAVDAAAAPQGNWREYVQARWRNEFFALEQTAKLSFAPVAAPVDGAPAGGEAPAPAGGAAVVAAPAPVAPPVNDAAFTAWWESCLRAGFYQASGGSPELAGVSLRSDLAAISGEPAALAGAGNVNLVLYAHPFLEDGRYANVPWAQEVPEPLTGHMWDTWALVHPDLAAELGVKDNDAIEISTDKGKIEVGVEVHRHVRKDTVAVHLGNGHTASGRYADGTGVSPWGLLGAVVSPTGVWALQQAKATVKSLGRKADTVTTFGGDTDEGRNFSVMVPVDAIKDVGDREAHHPGEATSIHMLPLDKRLQDAKISGFYPLPDHPVYRFGLTVDTNACTGCGACVVACYAENNLPVVGKEKTRKNREMGWIRVNRFYEGDEIVFAPMMCQQCGHAPCESVCPVLATYHSLEGLNAMIYNRCVGTRYCANACPYSVRKFNYHSYIWPEPFHLQLNPDVTARTVGVMEKCTFCVQRIRKAKSVFRDRGFTTTVDDAALRQLPACAEACPSQALTFGNLNDEGSVPYRSRKSARHYIPLEDLNVSPAVNYLGRASFHATAAHHEAGGHAAGAEHAEGANAQPAHEAAPHGEAAPAPEHHDAH